MRTTPWLRVAVAALIAAVAVIAIPPAAQAAPSVADGLDVYVGTLERSQWDTVRSLGVAADELGLPPVPGKKVPVEVILSRRQAERLTAAGIPLSVKPKTAAMRSRMAASPT